MAEISSYRVGLYIHGCVTSGEGDGRPLATITNISSLISNKRNGDSPGLWGGGGSGGIAGILTSQEGKGGEDLYWGGLGEVGVLEGRK